MKIQVLFAPNTVMNGNAEVIAASETPSPNVTISTGSVQHNHVPALVAMLIALRRVARRRTSGTLLAGSVFSVSPPLL